MSGRMGAYRNSCNKQIKTGIGSSLFERIVKTALDF
jgi:hypothetical protein